MSSDTSKAVERLFRTLDDERFIKTIEGIREQFSIPREGFQNERKFEAWLNKTTQNYLLAIYQMAVSFDLPLNDLGLYGKFVALGGHDWSKYDNKKRIDVLYILDPKRKLRIDEEDTLREQKIPYVKVLIPDFASKHEAVESITKNWSEIQKVLDKQRGGPKKRIVKNIHKTRDSLIKSIYKKSDAELGRPKHIPKDIWVARLLREKHGLKVEPETIKKVAYRKPNGPQKK